jgi:hypothetical protein
MANQQTVKIAFKVDGLDGYIDNLDDLSKALTDAAKDQEDLNKNVDDLDKKGKKGGSALKKLGSVGKKAFQGLKGAIAATGIGLLLTGLAQLVEWFKESDTGAKILQGTTAALGAIFGQLQTIFFDLVDLIKPLFEDPVQSIKDFGQAIVDNIVNRFVGILELIPNLAKAIGEVFKGNFEEAGTIAANAVGKVVLGVEDTVGAITTAVEVVQDFGAKAVKVYNDTAKAVVAAVDASNRLIDAQNALRALQQDLTVQNAQLTQELETQQKIADDTTRSYDERKEALDRVNAANEELADNAVKLAEQERNTLALALQVAKTDEERREIKDSLADAEAALIDAETAAQIVRLESAQLNRELDLEEVDRKKSINDTIAGLRLENIENEQEAALAALDLAEQQTLAELDTLKATEEEKQAVRDEFAAKRDKLAKDEALKAKKLDKDVQNAKVQAAVGALQAIAAISAAFAGDNEKAAKRNFKIQKALSLATTVISGIEGVQNAFTTANKSPITALFPAYPFIQAGLAGAFSAAQLVAIGKSKFTPGGGPPPPPSVSGGGGGAGAGGGVSFTPPDLDFTEQQTQQIGQGDNETEPIKAYVIAGDVTTAQEANREIENLATL